MEFNNSDKKTILLCLIGVGGSNKISNEPISGSIKLMKEAFLLQVDYLGEKFPYHFIPYDFGPCSFEIYDDLNLLIKEGIVNEEKNNSFSIYSVSSSYEELVKQLLANLDPSIRNAILKIKKDFNKLSYYSLIAYVYDKHPQFTRASKFKLY